MQEKIKLSIIIVTYNDCRHLKCCTDSIYQKFGGFDSWEIIIVNNDKRQNIEGLSLDFSKIKIIDHGKNGGFGSGMNIGAKQARGEYLLILNPDTEIRTDNIEAVLSRLSKDEKVGILGGGIIDRDGNKQKWSAGKEISLYDLARNNLGVSRSKNIWNSSREISCDWVAGTVLFVKRSLFERLGGFDENFFMYFEDMDLCKRVRASGKDVTFFPEFVVFHGNGESYIDKRLQKTHYYDSMEKYFRKQHRFAVWLILKVIRKILKK